MARNALPHPHGADTRQGRGENTRIPRRSPPERGRGEAGAPAREERGPHRSPGLRAEVRRARGSLRRKESLSFAHWVLQPRTHHLRQDPRRNGNNESRLPRHPRPESGRGRRRHLLSYPRGHTPLPGHPAASSRPQPGPNDERPRTAAPAPSASPPALLTGACPSPGLRWPRLERDSGPSRRGRRRRRTIWRASASAMEFGKYNRGRSIFMRD